MLLTYSITVFNGKLWGLFLYNHCGRSTALWKHSKRLTNAQIQVHNSRLPIATKQNCITKYIVMVGL